MDPTQSHESDQIMDRALKTLLKGSTLVLIGLVIAKVLTFLRQYTIIRFLTPEDYGLYSLGMTIILIYVLVCSLGLPTGAQRYIAYFLGRDELPRLKGAIYDSMWVLGISTTVATALSVVLAKPLSLAFDMPELYHVMLWLSPLIPLTVIVNTSSSFFLGFQRVGVKVFLQEIGACLLSAALTIAFLAFRNELTFALVAMVSSYVLVAAIAALYSVLRFPIKLGPLAREKTASLLLRFSIPIFAFDAFNYLMIQIDTLMLGVFWTSNVVGIYNAGFLLVQMLAIFLSSLVHIFMSVTSEMIAKNHVHEVGRLYKSATRWVLIFTFPLFLTFFLFPSDTLALVYGAEYVSAARALQILCIGELFHTLLGPNGMTLLSFGKSKLLMTSSGVVVLINLALNLTLTPRFGMNGAAVATFSALTLRNIYYSLYLYAKYRIHPFNKGFFASLAAMLVPGAALYAAFSPLLDISRWFLLSYYPLVLAFCLIILSVTRNLAEEDKALFYAVKRKLSGKKA